MILHDLKARAIQRKLEIVQTIRQFSGLLKEIKIKLSDLDETLDRLTNLANDDVAVYNDSDDDKPELASHRSNNNNNLKDGNDIVKHSSLYDNIEK